MTFPVASPDGDGAARTVAGRYQLREILGRGGMGTVWLAEDLLLRREVALKELLFPATLEPEQQEELRQRSLREAQAAARISSPHAVKVYDVVTDGGLPWIVMERHHGRTLSEIVRADGPRSPAETARIGLAVLAALENAHAAGIVHRDVKPANVLVRADGHVTLTDFGIARGIEDTTITRTGMIVGSPAYVAPERATGAPALPPSDLWALGATLYTAVEGHPPFDRGDPMQTLAAVMYAEPQPCSAAGPLAPLIGSLLAKDPAARPTIPAARGALQAVVAGGGAATAGTRTLPVPGPVSMGDRTVLLESGPAAPPRLPPPPPAVSTNQPAPAGPAPLWPALPPPGRPRPPVRSAPATRPRRSGTRIGVAVMVLALVGAASAVLAASRNRSDGTPPVPKVATASTPAAKSSVRAGAGAGAGAAVAVRTPSSPPTATDTATPSATPSSSGSASSATPSASASAAPASRSAGTATGGLVQYTDPAVGWSIAKPAQWRVRQRGSLTDLVDPATGRYLRIDTTDKPKPSAVGAWEDLESSFAGRHSDYTRIAMNTISWRGFDDVADWEYSYRNRGGRLHAINRGIVTGGRAYALNFQAQEDEWAASQPLMQQLFASFQPAN